MLQSSLQPIWAGSRIVFYGVACDRPSEDQRDRNDGGIGSFIYISSHSMTQVERLCAVKQINIR